MMATTFDELMKDPAQRRIYEQESLAFEATELISTLMERDSVTKADLAQRIGKSRAFVSQLLSGTRNMTLHTFADLAFALGQQIRLDITPLDRRMAKHIYSLHPVKRRFFGQNREWWTPCHAATWPDDLESSGPVSADEIDVATAHAA